MLNCSTSFSYLHTLGHYDFLYSSYRSCESDLYSRLSYQVLLCLKFALSIEGCKFRICCQLFQVNSVRLPRHVADKKLFCGTALVEFSTEEDANKILKETLNYGGVELELKPK